MSRPDFPRPVWITPPLKMDHPRVIQHLGVLAALQSVLSKQGDPGDPNHNLLWKKWITLWIIPDHPRVIHFVRFSYFYSGVLFLDRAKTTPKYGLQKVDHPDHPKNQIY